MSTNRHAGDGRPGDADRDPRLDRAYRDAPREEPPAHLDAAILAAAHRAVGARPRAASERLRAWRVPVSIAAVVVLSVSVVTLVREEGGDRLDSSTANMASRNMSGAPAPQVAEEGASGRDRAARSESARDAGSTREQEALKRKASRDDGAPAAKEEAGQRAAAESAKLSEDAARRRSAEAAAELSAAAEPRAPAPPPAAPAPQPSQRLPALRDPRQAPSGGSASGADVAQSTLGARSSSGESLYAPEELKPQSPGGPADRSAVRERAAAADSVGSLSAQRPAPAAKATPRVESRSIQAETSAVPASRISALMKELESQPAEKWLEKIESLRREARRAEADELLAEFRRRFPDYPLPATLR